MVKDGWDILRISRPYFGGPFLLYGTPGGFLGMPFPLELNQGPEMGRTQRGLLGSVRKLRKYIFLDTRCGPYLLTGGLTSYH